MQRTETAIVDEGQLQQLEAELRTSGVNSLLRLIRKYPLVAVFISILSLLLAIALFAPLLAPYSQFKTHPAQSLQSPSLRHWLGTDQLGRDTLSRVIYGVRVSLQVGIIAVVIGATVGITLGLIAGYGGGVVDQILVRPDDEILIMTSANQVIRIRVSEIRKAGRSTKGVRLQRLQEGDEVIALTNLGQQSKTLADITGEELSPIEN